MGLVAAWPAAAQMANSTDGPCAQAAQSQAASLEANPPQLPSDALYAPIDAEAAYLCAQSVPFVAEHGSELVELAKQYFQFQTTLAFLKDPPAGYQQPGIDVMGTLDQIASNIKAGEYATQYEFDYAIYSLVSGTHEEHFNLNVGVLGLFTWLLPDSLVAVSSDGQELPQVYALSDVVRPEQDYKSSPIVSIDGQSTVAWLQAYAAAYTQIADNDPNGDWNVLMSNPPFQFNTANINQASYWPSWVQGTTVYYGPSLNGTFENGTTFDWPYVAGSFFPLQSSGFVSSQAIYDNYVLNPTTASQTANASAAMSTTAAVTSSLPTETAVPFANYPSNPAVVEDGLGAGGTVSGYILEDVSVGVLSLPSFESGDTDPSASAFSAAVDKFITLAKKAKVKKVVVDISGNGGGTTLQGIDTFKRFFPINDPFIGFRTRAFPFAKTLGTIMTDLSVDRSADFPSGFETFIMQQQDENFGSLDAGFTMQPNGSAWTSWAQFAGPISANGDTFTRAMQFNLSSQIDDEDAFGDEFVASFGNDQLHYDQPWDAADIIMLSDGQCGSTCSVFSELMNTNGGVKTVVVGGVPSHGPMQSVTGTRGGSVIDWQTISDLATEVKSVFSTQNSKAMQVLQSLGLSMSDVHALPPPLSSIAYQIQSARFNALDEVRGDDPTPLQFIFEPADCRLFYTADMIRNITQLWRAAAVVAAGDYSACVPGSTGVSHSDSSGQSSASAAADSGSGPVSSSIGAAIAYGLSMQRS